MGAIFLCGFMGCGKSTVGRQLAKLTGRGFVDLDEYIEQKELMSIPEIFEKKGEGYFRELETAALNYLAGKESVVATGGGALLSEKNAAIAGANGMTVFIDTPFEICYDRIKNDEHRPIAASSTREQLLARFEDRYPKYKAHSDILTDGCKEPLQIAKDIAEQIKKL